MKKKLLKQGIDPTTHKPLTDAHVKEESKSPDTTPMQIPMSQGTLATSTFGSSLVISDSSHYDGVLTEASRELFMSKSALDSLSYYDFQMGGSVQSGYNNLPFTHYQSFGPSSSHGFSSMPSLTQSDHGNMSSVVTEFSDNNSASKISSLFMNDQVKESSSISSNMSTIYPGGSHSQMRSLMENAGFSWDNGDNKLDPLFQFQVNGIKSEDFRTSSWEEGQLQNQSSIDFTSCPLTSLSEDLTEANFDVFQHI